MMKTRLATNIDGYPLRLVLSFEYAYSADADLILSYWNSNEKSGPAFSVFSVCRQNVVLREKLPIFSCS